MSTATCSPNDHVAEIDSTPIFGIMSIATCERTEIHVSTIGAHGMAEPSGKQDAKHSHR